MAGYEELGESQEQGLESWQPQNFHTRHKHIVMLHVAGMRNCDIAEQLGYTESRVSQILTDPRAKEMVARMSTEFIEQLTIETQDRIQGAALEAFEKVLYLMRHAESERIQQVSAFDILDRAGFKPKEQQISAKLVIEGSDVKRLIAALQESKSEPEALEMVQDTAGVFKKATDVTTARK